MSRLTDFRRDVAYYFGVGRGSGRDSDEPEPSLLSAMLHLVAVLAIAAVIREVLNVESILAGLGLTIAVAVAWGLGLRLVRHVRGAGR